MTPKAATMTVAVIAIGIAAFVLMTSSSRFIWGDDGIYVSTARALAERHEYRLINLPTEPYQTKYPPLYPTLLALAWPAGAGYPDAALHLKVVNALALALIVLMTARLAGRAVPGRNMAPVVAALLAAVSPALVSHGEQLTSDLWFTVFLLAVCSLPKGDRWTTPDALAACALAGLSVLTRTIGLAVVLGLLLDLARRGGRARTAVGAALIGIFTVPWAIWRFGRLQDVGPLLQGYVTYERSLWLLLPDAPVLASRLILKNVAGLALSAEVVLGTVTWWFTGVVVLIAILGAVQCRRQTWVHTAVAIGSTYVVVVVGHPYPMIRYLVPLVPLLLVAFVSGVWAMARNERWRRPGIVSGCLAGVLWIVLNAAWLARFSEVTHDAIHGGFGRPMQLSWAGFDNTFQYIRNRTPPSAVLASPYESLYFVFTGRHAVRPWFHASDLYEPAYGVGPYGCEDVAALHAELRRLHVSYLIVDPMLNDLDSGYGTSCVAGLLERYGPEWTLTYTSLDGQHRVYRSLVESPSIGQRIR